MKRKWVNKMKKFNVYYDGGEARALFENGVLAGVDYMMVHIPAPEDNEENIELYAERIADENDENANFDDLVSDILEQAKEYGYTKDNFLFPFDDGHENKID